MKDILLMLAGGLIALAVAVMIEFLRRPKLAISIKKPDDFPLGAAARTPARSLKLIIRNKALWWMSRDPALQARGEIVFRHSDGREVFGRTMEARWARAPEPIPLPAIDTNGQMFQIIDFARFTSGTRMDIYPGDEEELDIAVRIDPDQECYGWNNEAYFAPSVGGRNPKWRLPAGRYIAEARIRSSGQTRVELFQLFNDGGREDMRLEKLTKPANARAIFSTPPRWFRTLKPIDIFTAVLCIVAGFQAWAFVQSERAFVFPSHVEFAEPLMTADIQSISLSVDMRNSGRSVAQVSNMVVAVTHELSQTPTYGKGISQQEVAFPPIPSNGQIRQDLNFSTWGKQTMSEVRDGLRPFYFFGKISYFDDYWLFGSRTSEFCFVYKANKTDPNKAVFRNCPEPQFTGTK